MNEILNNATSRMDKSIASLGQAFNKIRTGRANPAILDDIKVDYYGNLTVLNQTASISVEDGRSLVISPWDKSLIPEIEKAISNSNLGLNPSTSSDLIRITMPALTEETRQDYIKQARAEAENSRVSIRNIRRDANQASKELQSSGEISEDDLRRIEDLIQKETDKYIGLVDSELKAKESDILLLLWMVMVDGLYQTL
ncbi:MAG: ribosome recycling factor [Proteobacteria bacterium]|nr:ribosome recycling factor [Pseudomonadota bacterium]